MKGRQPFQAVTSATSSKGYCTNQAATGNEIPAVGGLCAPCLQLQVSVWLKDFDCNTKWRPEV